MSRLPYTALGEVATSAKFVKNDTFFLEAIAAVMDCILNPGDKGYLPHTPRRYIMEPFIDSHLLILSAKRP
jgi:hypothetical protein